MLEVWELALSRPRAAGTAGRGAGRGGVRKERGRMKPSCCLTEVSQWVSETDIKE